MAQRLKETVLKAFDDLSRLDTATLLERRYQRLRSYGAYEGA